MVHLEILAGKIVTAAQEAARLAAHYTEKGDRMLTSYCMGTANGLRMAADMLRLKALKRKGTDKEASE